MEIKIKNTMLGVKFVFWASILFYSVQLNAQFSPCYHYGVAKANHLVTYENDCEGALQYLERAFEAVEDTIAKDLLIAAKVYDCLEQGDKVMFCFVEAIKKAGYDWEKIEDWRDRNILGNYETRFLELERVYPKSKVEYKSRMDLDWYRDLFALGKTDQYLRSALSRRQMEKCSFEGEKKYALMGITDSLNMQFLIEKIKKQGFPPLQYLDFEATRGVFLSLMHGGIEVWAWNFFEEILVEQIEKGNFDPNLYAKIHDRHLQQIVGREQGFGAYNSACIGKVVCPIERIEEVDKRRLSIGLLPLKESYEGMTGYLLPESYEAPTEKQMEEWLSDCW